jgi:hypothetical protein
MHGTKDALPIHVMKKIDRMNFMTRNVNLYFLHGKNRILLPNRIPYHQAFLAKLSSDFYDDDVMHMYILEYGHAR